MAGNIDALRAHVAGMMGKGVKNSPSAKARVKAKGKSTRMKQKSQTNC